MKKDIASLDYDELIKEMELIGEKSFRGKQIYSWLHEKLARSFDEMTNLSKALRDKLNENYSYMPKIYFEGYTECFSDLNFDEIEEIINKYKIKITI